MSRAFQLAAFRRPSPPELVLEPLRRGDVVAVTELFEAMSTRSRRQRFLTSVPRLTAKMLAHLSDVDGVGHIAVAARAHGRCVGIARAVVVRGNPDVAEVAIAVADAHQGKGLGRRLVDALAQDARALGIREFEATIDPANHAALGLARAVTSTSWYDEGQVRTRWSLPLARSA